MNIYFYVFVRLIKVCKCLITNKKSGLYFRKIHLILFFGIDFPS
nr:MAG TPA: hypothetical protein [Caudoviricetes sp.]